MSTARLNTMRLNTVSLNAMPINRIGIKKGVSSSASGDVDENGYIIFADPEVERVLLANGVGDGVGITKEAAAAVTGLKGWFKNNTTLETFDELRLFKNVVLDGTLAQIYGQFVNCTNLRSISLPVSTQSIGIYAFAYCTSLTNVTMPHNTIRSIGAYAFIGCSALDQDIILPVLTTLGDSAFKNSGITTVVLPSITIISGAYAQGNGTFYGAASLSTALIGPAITSIGIISFRYCASLSTVIIQASAPPTLGSDAFSNTPIASGTGSIYVPDDSVEAYKAATNWATYAARIFPISQLPTDNPDLYAEIEEYL